ncbi:Basic proline-rich protein precursor [Pimelobacter simplex]|uniref:Basic proline-rich protein n=1 Tax=Nocardioides simplex TaxID=2045 RepID=A0A0A1DJB9_NOCSI|nr:Basic proline-rich protein precursor [Pimelobacter simplex]
MVRRQLGHHAPQLVDRRGAGEQCRVGAPEQPVGARHPGLGGEDADVLAPGDRPGVDDQVLPAVLEGGRHPGAGVGVVVDGREALEELDLGLARRTGGRRLATDDPLDRGQHLRPHVLVGGAHRELQLRLLRDDVRRGARVERAHRHHRRVTARDLARHHRLQPQHRRRPQHHRVDRRLGSRPVPTLPVQHDPQAVGRRERRPRMHPQHPHRQRRHVLTQHHVRLPEPLEEPVGHHVPRAVAVLLVGLEHQQHPPPPLRVLREPRRRPQQARHVDVVPARVHHRVLLAVGRRRGRRARVRQPGVLLHGQAVHVGAQQHRRACASLERRDDAGASDAGRDVVLEGAEVVGDDARRPVLLAAQLGVAVEVLVDRGQGVGGGGHGRILPGGAGAGNGRPIASDPRPSVGPWRRDASTPVSSSSPWSSSPPRSRGCCACSACARTAGATRTSAARSRPTVSTPRTSAPTGRPSSPTARAPRSCSSGCLPGTPAPSRTASPVRCSRPAARTCAPRAARTGRGSAGP